MAREFSESARFDLRGVMVDVSRNGVLRPETMKALMRRCALMGINTFIAYAEDTYEVPGEPFFGYLRGRYTQKELGELDAYAERTGPGDVFGDPNPGTSRTGTAMADLRELPGRGRGVDRRGETDVQVDRADDSARQAPFRSRRLIVGWTKRTDWARVAI
jgi:hexosaminidase